MSASLHHRALSNVRTGSTPAASGAASVANPSTPTAVPHTPLRGGIAAYGSPSSLRADEDVLVVELGARRIRVGFAGDSVPKAIISFRPEMQRRAGDTRQWEPGFTDQWQRRGWSAGHELWKFDLRDLDLGLVGDRLERAIREAFTKYLLIDSRPRKTVLVLPSATPLPLLSAVLDTYFNRFQAPMISLLSSPVAAAVAAGVRSALVVDIGWAETVVTAVCEFREVRTDRSIRAGKMLVGEVHRLLAAALGLREESDYVVSFEECEEVAKRMLWCRPMLKRRSSSQFEDALETVDEEDEDEDARTAPESASEAHDVVSIPLHSTKPPTTVHIPFDDRAQPIESTFFPPGTLSSFDDDDLPLPRLLHHNLLHLPLDVRALAMSRIIFTGGCSAIFGLRARIFDELEYIVDTERWDGVRGTAFDTMRLKMEDRQRRRMVSDALPPPPVLPVPSSPGGESEEGEAAKTPPVHPALAVPEPDPTEEVMAAKAGGRWPPERPFQGTLRAIETVGPWAGASMANQLKVLPIACVDRELWLSQGPQGASRASEVDVKAMQRQSMGAGGLIRSAGAGSNNWTLGAWGVL